MAPHIRVANVSWNAQAGGCVHGHNTLGVQTTHVSLQARVQTLMVEAGQVVGAVIVDEAFRSLCGGGGLMGRQGWQVWATTSHEGVTYITRWTVTPRPVILCSADSQGRTGVSGEADFSADTADACLGSEAVLVHYTLGPLREGHDRGADGLVNPSNTLRISLARVDATHLATQAIVTLLIEGTLPASGTPNGRWAICYRWRGCGRKRFFDQRWLCQCHRRRGW